MDETVFPPSPSWFLPKILSTREDGWLCYGSKNDVIILKTIDTKIVNTVIIREAHELRVTTVAFPPSHCCESLKNTLVSGSEDGFAKLWNIDTLKPVVGHRSHWEQKESPEKIICVDWSSANPNHIVSAAENGSLVLWDVLSNVTSKFSFKRLIMTVVACCPYYEKLVAVGVKSGLVYIISLNGDGDVVYKLRGHDNEIQSLSWCPVPYNVFNSQELYEEFLLASSCQNKEIYIWRAGTDGMCEAKIQIPTCPISKKALNKNCPNQTSTFRFLAIFWQDAYTLYLSSSFGELLLFDIKQYSKKVLTAFDSKSSKQSLHSLKVAHHIHDKGLYAISGHPLNGNVVLYENIEVKSGLRFNLNLENKIVMSSNFEGKNENIKWEINNSKSHALLWTSGQDRKLVASKIEGHTLNVVFNIHSLNGLPYTAAVYPHDLNKIAIAGGDGVIRLWNILQPSGEIQMFWKKIKDKVMSLAWHPIKDGLLAYGTSVGRVGLIDTNANKDPKIFKPSHLHPIYNLSWGPQFPSDDQNSKKDFGLYCVGDNTLSLYNCSSISADSINLSKIIPFQCKKQTDVSWKPDNSIMAVGNEDGSINFVEPHEFKIVYTLLVYKKLIQSIAWHPASTSSDLGLSPYHSYFTAGSTDNECEIRVFNYLQEGNTVKVEKVATLKGHYGQIHHVSWSPHSSAMLVSSSADCSVQIWDVRAQTPLFNFSAITMPSFSIWSPTNPDIVLTGCRNRLLTLWKISNQTNSIPSAKLKKQKKDKMQMIVSKESTEESIELEKKLTKECDNLSMAEAKSLGKNTKNVKMFTKAWKSDSSNELSNFYDVLKAENVDDDNINFTLQFLCEDKYQSLIDSEVEAHKSSCKLTEYLELLLWKGNIKEAIEEKIQTGQLNDFLVSLAPTISPRLWQEACLSYSKSLLEKKSYRKAASYLIACHKVYDAINLLLNENLFLEALCIAKSRLPKSDPLIDEIVKNYGFWLFQNGSFLKACECYLYLKEYDQVAKILGKKSQPEYLSLAALAARKSGSLELEYSEATNALLKCFSLNNFDLAQRICDDHPNFKHLRIMYVVYYTISQLINRQLILKSDIISYIRNSMDTTDVFLLPTMAHLYQKYVFYKSKEEMYVVVSQEIFFAICSSDKNEVLLHLVKALSSCYRYIHNTESEEDPLFELCTWLCPKSFLSEESYFWSQNSEDVMNPIVESLREFLGAAIVRNLKKKLFSENVMQWIEILEKLSNSFLNKDSFNYFKNLSEVEICEKRLVSNQNLVAKKKLLKLEGTQIFENKESPINNGMNSSEINNSKNGEVQDEKLFKNIDIIHKIYSEPNNLQLSEEKKSDESAGKICKNTSENGLSQMILVEENTNEISEVQKKIHHDKGVLNKLRNEINIFEAKKIASPNPVPVFCILKEICNTVPESKTAQALLEKLEKKWKELN